MSTLARQLQGTKEVQVCSQCLWPRERRSCFFQESLPSYTPRGSPAPWKASPPTPRVGLPRGRFPQVATERRTIIHHQLLPEDPSGRPHRYLSTLSPGAKGKQAHSLRSLNKPSTEMGSSLLLSSSAPDFPYPLACHLLHCLPKHLWNNHHKNPAKWNRHHRGNFLLWGFRKSKSGLLMSHPLCWAVHHNLFFPYYI